jgi:hypothetical protein
MTKRDPKKFVAKVGPEQARLFYKWVAEDLFEFCVGEIARLLRADGRMSEEQIDGVAQAAIEKEMNNDDSAFLAKVGQIAMAMEDGLLCFEEEDDRTLAMSVTEKGETADNEVLSIWRKERLAS